MLDENGKTVNQQIADLMWEDLRERIKELGVSFLKLLELFFYVKSLFFAFDLAWRLLKLKASMSSIGRSKVGKFESSKVRKLESSKVGKTLAMQFKV